LIDKNARSKEATRATTDKAKTTVLAKAMAKLNAVLTRRRYLSKADGDSRRLFGSLVLYLPKLSSLALEQVMWFTRYDMFKEAGVSIKANDLFNSCPSHRRTLLKEWLKILLPTCLLFVGKLVVLPGRCSCCCLLPVFANVQYLSFDLMLVQREHQPGAILRTCF
jgi:hypothetical protein